MRTRSLLQVLAALCFFSSSATALPTLYGVIAGPNGERDFATIDADTGQVSVIGPHGLPFVTSLARDASTGTLYAWQSVNGLITLDPVTGAATRVDPSTSYSLQVGSVSFGADGNLYAVNGTGPELYRIDLATGAPSVVVSNFLPDMGGMDLSPTGELFASTSSGQLYRNLDIVTVVPESTVQLEMDDGSDFDALLQSLAFAPTGELIGSAFRFAQFEDVQYQYNSALDRWEFMGAAPGVAGSGTNGNGETFFFDAEGNTTEAYTHTGTPILVPSHFTLTVSQQTAPSRDLLFDVDPVTGVVSNLRDFSFGIAQGLVFVPEPNTALLVMIGLLGLRARRRSLERLAA